MGNKLGRRRQVVDDKYTRPQGLYLHKDVDQKKLRKLILDSKLAPCFPGDDDCGCELEECPICFLYYPSLNRSRCCTKGICTECFLQMRTPNSTRPTQCPFCKTSNYAVEYRGVKTKEEKGLEQMEEQKFIEAKIRMRRQEVQEEEDRMLKQREIKTSSSLRRPSEVDYCSTGAPSFTSAVDNEEILASHEPSEAMAMTLSPLQRQNRDGEFDLDLEDIMVMEAIWLSIQGGRRGLVNSDVTQREEYMVDYQSSTPMIAPVSGSSASPSGGLACAIAALAEKQQISGETPDIYGEKMSAYNMPGCSRYSSHERQEFQNYFPAEIGIMASPNSQLIRTEDAGEWVDHRSEMAEIGTSYGGSEEFDDPMRPGEFLHQDESRGSFQPAAGTIIPESFEEQMMLAMALSLAETRIRTNPPGVAWH